MYSYKEIINGLHYNPPPPKKEIYNLKIENIIATALKQYDYQKKLIWSGVAGANAKRFTPVNISHATYILIWIQFLNRHKS